MKRMWMTVLGSALLSGTLYAAPSPDSLPVPPVPATSASAVTLPPVPRFALPSTANGQHDVRELHVRGRALLDRELTVRGYITWIYDCVKGLRRRGVPREVTRRLVDDHPELCERPKFYLGARPDAPPDLALPVVDVPRPPNQREILALTVAQLALRPPAPSLAIGDHVAVTGTFAQQSPHGEQSTEGLLVYRGLVHVPPTRRRLVDVGDAPFVPPSTSPPPREVVSTRSHNDSIDAYERCNQALELRHPLAAASACRQALAAWRGNHLAWYALGNAYAMREEWPAAQDAYAHAAQLRPDAAMYQLYAGVAAYQLAAYLAAHPADEAPVRDPSLAGRVLAPAVLAARLSRAALTREAVLGEARVALARAVERAPGHWAASYYLGKTELALDHARLAAQAFTAAIVAEPAQAEPYIALLELYRAWDFGKQGLAIAQTAATRVTAGNVAGAWYSIGMAFTANGRDRDAIAAFDRASAGEPARALFQRGQIYARLRERSRAREDLERFLGLADPSLGVARQIARDLLASIARGEYVDSTYLRNGGQLTGALDSR